MIDARCGLRRIVGVGSGGHAKAILDVLDSMSDWEVVGLVDKDIERVGQRVLGVQILGGDELLPALFGSGVDSAFVGVGGVRDNAPRQAVYQRLVDLGFAVPVLIHRAATVSRWVSIGSGTVLLAGAIVNAGTRLGENVIVNSGAIIEHDCDINDHVHVAPGARLAGNVHVGCGAHIGIGAVVLQGRTIGPRAVVGAGAVVVRDVAPVDVVVGAPARPLRHGMSAP